MIKIRKILAVVYLVSCLSLLTGLAMYWFSVEPVASFMKANQGDTMMRSIVLTTLGITTLGTLGYVIRTIAQRGKNTFQRSSNELGAVQISRAAIVHEVSNAMSSHPEVKHLKTNVTIKNRRNPYANVYIRVAPRGSLDMPEVVASIQRDVKEAVTRLTGNEVRKVTIDVRRNNDSDTYDASVADEAKSAHSRELDSAASENAVGDVAKEPKRKRRRGSGGKQTKEDAQIHEDKQVLNEEPAAEAVIPVSNDEEPMAEGETEPQNADSEIEAMTQPEAENVDDASDSKE
ncbi:MAG: alkaline shock response membrane anchor protein AmaP [Eggerthellaceae bacterium]|nr:alkaline shock response membrane anchor protein AmaP [Eggerthellaceae bacterium]